MVQFPLHGAGAVTAQGLLSRFLKTSVVEGAAASTNIAIAGIDARTDEIISVVELRNPIKSFDATGATATTNFTVTGIVVGDVVTTIHHATGAGTDVTDIVPLDPSEATVAAGLVQLSTTDTSSNTVLISWTKINVDRTSEAEITSRGNIQLSATSAGSTLLVLWSDRQVNG